LGVRGTKAVFDGRTKIKSESDEIKQKGLGKTIENYPDEEKKEEDQR
jgi:hypothetical protein